MSTTANNLVASDQRDRIARLQFFARDVVEGLMSGKHRSPHFGSSVEFKEHRPYVRGDEIRSIDWKLYGKTDRLFIRQYDDETNLQAMLAVDQSASMSYCGTRSEGISKHEFAIRIAACFATLLIGQQDAVGLATVDHTLQKVIPARSTLRHLGQVLREMALSTPAPTAASTKRADEVAAESNDRSHDQCQPITGGLEQLATLTKRRGLLALFSDCFDDFDQLMTSLTYFRKQGNEVVVFHILDQDEIDFPFQGRSEFRALEGTARHRIDPRGLRQAYLQRLREFRGRLQRELSRAKVDLVPCVVGDDCGEILSRLIANRGSGRQRGAARGQRP